MAGHSKWAHITERPSTTITLLDEVEGLDDVHNVYTNANLPESLLAAR